jgi:hypothetical protein
MFAYGKRAKVCAHVPEVATGRERSPLLSGWALEAIRAVVGVVKAADSLAILLDKLLGYNLA